MIEYIPIVETPCISLCVLDDATGWCLGCGRTIDEVCDWSERSPEQREAIMAALPARMAQLEG
ncbi:MAG: DUF1289 domain-containing protein [Sphingomonadales bacterium]|nr:MAG: DUF1289 domain-containing protein [Sphingomonadales bacterium]